MTLYHTSNTEVPHPDIAHSRKHLDFGQGFYLTAMKARAESYGQRFIRRGEPAVVNMYELCDIPEGFIRKKFARYDSEWLDFVAANRKGLPAERYDFIEGGVADDQVFDTIDLYFSGIIDKEQALNQLRFKKPNHQICIASQPLIDRCLKFVNSTRL